MSAKGKPMILRTKWFTLPVLAGALLLTAAPTFAQETAKQDMKEAGHDTKQAVKKTGHGIARGTKTVARKTKNGTKKVVHGAAKGTETGAAKVEDKTAPK